jgi:hypothetical protein
MHTPSSAPSQQSPGQSPKQWLQWRVGGILTPHGSVYDIAGFGHDWGELTALVGCDFMIWEG